MALDYEQHLSDKLKLLYFDDFRYERLRNFIQFECKDEIVFEVRKDEIHIYYLGGRILKIIKSRDRLRFSFDLKYAKKQKGSDALNEYGDTVKKLNDNPFDVDLWLEHFGDLKRCMKNYRDNVSHNAERQLQQNLELKNRDFGGEVVVIDNEYGAREVHAISSKLCKVDLVTLYRDNEKYKICLVELKCGDGSIDGKAGIIDHIKDFDTLIAKRRADIIASVNNLIEYKKQNHSLYNVPDNLRLSEDTEIRGSILCYDLSKVKKCRVEASIKQQKVAFDLHFKLDLDSSCHILTKKDILGE